MGPYRNRRLTSFSFFWQWTRVNFTIEGADTVVADIPLASSDDEVVGLRYDWEGYPQCALYNGVGGPDDHTGIAAPPFLIAPPVGKQPLLTLLCKRELYRQTLFGFRQSCCCLLLSSL